MLNFFWKRDRIAHGLVKESEVDLQSLCEAARLAVNRIPRLEAENGNLRERIDDVIDERQAIGNRVGQLHDENRQLREQLAEVSKERDDSAAIAKRFIEREMEVGNQIAAAYWQRDRAVERSAAMEKERDEARAEAERLQAAYEDMAGALAMMNVEALKVLETLPEEARPETTDAGGCEP